LKESIVLDKLNKVSAFLKTTSLKSADKGDLKEQSNQYWQEEKTKEVEHKQALSAHEQQKQSTLASTKVAEQRRLEDQAKASLGALEQQRQQDTASFRAREEARSVVQTKMREENTQRVLADVTQRKQANYTPADAAHNIKQATVTTPSTYVQETPAPKPASAAKKAPGKLGTPAAFTAPAASTPPPAASRPPPAASKPASKPAPKPAPPAPKHAPEPEPVYEPEPEPEAEAEPEPEPAFEPEPTYNTYEEPAEEQPAYDEPVDAYAEEPVDEPKADTSYPQARALYDYAAETETDLSFAEGDIINILEDTDPSGWWKGELNGAEGFFPSNYVESI